MHQTQRFLKKPCWNTIGHGRIKEITRYDAPIAPQSIESPKSGLHSIEWGFWVHSCQKKFDLPNSTLRKLLLIQMKPVKLSILFFLFLNHVEMKIYKSLIFERFLIFFRCIFFFRDPYFRKGHRTKSFFRLGICLLPKLRRKGIASDGDIYFTFIFGIINFFHIQRGRKFIPPPIRWHFECLRIEFDRKTSASWAVMEATFIIIRITVSGWTRATNQFHKISIHNDPASALIWSYRIWATQHSAISCLLITSESVRCGVIPFFAWR